MHVRCPTCGRNFDPDASQAMPFCSPRCKQIDLGRWLDERIGLPVKRNIEEDDPEASELPEGWDNVEEN
jgi:endogenous inhibitor of DNA gyrase (YacG/DUF329 family)